VKETGPGNAGGATVKDQLVLSERTLTVSLIALYTALGGGWDPASPGEAPR